MRYTYCTYQLPTDTCSISLCKWGDSANGTLLRRGESQEQRLWRDRNQVVINRIANMVDGYPDEIGAFLSDLTLQNFSSLLYPKGFGWSACNVPLCHPHVCDRYMGIFDNRGNLRDPTHPWGLNRLLLLLHLSLNGEPLSDFPEYIPPKSEDRTNVAPQNALPDVPETAGFAGLKRSSVTSKRHSSLVSNDSEWLEMIRTKDSVGYRGDQFDQSREQIVNGHPYPDSPNHLKTKRRSWQDSDSPKRHRLSGDQHVKGLDSPTIIEYDIQSFDEEYNKLHHVDSYRLSKDTYWLRKAQRAAEAKQIIKKYSERNGNLVNGDNLANAIRRVRFDDLPPKKKYRQQDHQLALSISQMYNNVVEKKPGEGTRLGEPSNPRKYVADQVPVLFHEPFAKEKPWTWQRRHPQQMRVTAENKIGSSHIKRYQRRSVQKEMDDLRKFASLHSMYSTRHINSDEKSPDPMFGHTSKKGHKPSHRRPTITSDI